MMRKRLFLPSTLQIYTGMLPEDADALHKRLGEIDGLQQEELVLKYARKLENRRSRKNALSTLIFGSHLGNVYFRSYLLIFKRQDTEIAQLPGARRTAREARVASKAPIRLTDCVGRKFNLPWAECKTWKGMDSLIKQAFLHVDGIGEHVNHGHYDLTTSDGDIILPQVWEATILPNMEITQHLWPMPEDTRNDQARTDGTALAVPFADLGVGLDGLDGGKKKKKKKKESSGPVIEHMPPLPVFPGPLPPGAIPMPHFDAMTSPSNIIVSDKKPSKAQSKARSSKELTPLAQWLVGGSSSRKSKGTTDSKARKTYASEDDDIVHTSRSQRSTTDRSRYPSVFDKERMDIRGRSDRSLKAGGALGVHRRALVTGSDGGFIRQTSPASTARRIQSRSSRQHTHDPGLDDALGFDILDDFDTQEALRALKADGVPSEHSNEVSLNGSYKGNQKVRPRSLHVLRSPKTNTRFRI